MGRKEVTKVLTDAASNYFINKMFSVFHEFGVGKRGQRRLDLLCLHTSLSVVGVEVKSCKVDYTTDKKWMEYLAYKQALPVPASKVNRIAILCADSGGYETAWHRHYVADSVWTPLCHQVG